MRGCLRAIIEELTSSDDSKTTVGAQDGRVLYISAFLTQNQDMIQKIRSRNHGLTILLVSVASRLRKLPTGTGPGLPLDRRSCEEYVEESSPKLIHDPSFLPGPVNVLETYALGVSTES